MYEKDYILHIIAYQQFRQYCECISCNGFDIGKLPQIVARLSCQNGIEFDGEYTFKLT